MFDRSDGPPMSQIIRDEGDGLSSSVGLRLSEILGDFAAQLFKGFIPFDMRELDVLATHFVVPLRWKRKHFSRPGLSIQDLDH